MTANGAGGADTPQTDTAATGAKPVHVSVTVNGRRYRLACDPADHDRVTALAEHVSDRVAQLIEAHGNASDDRLLLMTALLLADELWDSESRLKAALQPSEDPADET
ncbi:MAG: cell division protein ZapA [Pseudomonadota bacterium]